MSQTQLPQSSQAGASSESTTKPNASAFGFLTGIASAARPEKASKAEKNEKANNGEAENQDKGEKPDKKEKGGKSDKPAKAEKADEEEDKVVDNANKADKKENNKDKEGKGNKVKEEPEATKKDKKEKEGKEDKVEQAPETGNAEKKEKKDKKDKAEKVNEEEDKANKTDKKEKKEKEGKGEKVEDEAEAIKAAKKDKTEKVGEEEKAEKKEKKDKGEKGDKAGEEGNAIKAEKGDKGNKEDKNQHEATQGQPEASGMGFLAGFGMGARPDKSEKKEKAAVKGDKNGKGDGEEKPEKGDNAEKSDKKDKKDKVDKAGKDGKAEDDGTHEGGKADKKDKGNKDSKNDEEEKPDKGDNAEKSDKKDKKEKGDKTGKDKKDDKGNEEDKNQHEATQSQPEASGLSFLSGLGMGARPDKSEKKNKAAEKGDGKGKADDEEKPDKGDSAEKSGKKDKKDKKDKDGKDGKTKDDETHEGGKAEKKDKGHKDSKNDEEEEPEKDGKAEKGDKKDKKGDKTGKEGENVEDGKDKRSKKDKKDKANGEEKPGKDHKAEGAEKDKKDKDSEIEDEDNQVDERGKAGKTKKVEKDEKTEKREKGNKAVRVKEAEVPPQEEDERQEDNTYEVTENSVRTKAKGRNTRADGAGGAEVPHDQANRARVMGIIEEQAEANEANEEDEPKRSKAETGLDPSSTLATTLQKAYYKSNYLQSFLVDQEDQVLVDKDDKLREEMLDNLYKKWVLNTDELSASKAKLASDLMMATLKSQPALGTFPQNNLTQTTGDMEHSPQITSFHVSFLAVKWLPIFLQKWNLDSIRVQFYFFTEQEVTSHCLRYRGTLSPGVATAFQNPFSYFYRNRDYDTRLLAFLNKPLYIQITDSSRKLPLAYGLINLPPIVNDRQSANKIYEVDLFMPDDRNFLAGSIQITCSTTSEQVPKRLTKPPFQISEGEETSIIWSVEPGKANLLPLEVRNIYAYPTEAVISLKDSSTVPILFCKPEVVTDEEELEFWERDKPADAPPIPRLERGTDGRYRIKLMAHSAITVMVKLNVLSMNLSRNNPNKPNITYSLNVYFPETKASTQYWIVPDFSRSVISRSMQVYVPLESTVPCATVKFLDYSFSSNCATRIYGSSGQVPLVWLTDSNFSWKPNDLLEGIYVYWNRQEERREQATCDVILFGDAFCSEVLEVIRVTFHRLPTIQREFTLGLQNQILLSLDLSKGGSSKIHYISSGPQIVDLQGRDKPHAPYQDFNITVSLVASREMNREIALFCVDSDTDEVLQSWLISAKFVLPEIVENDTELQDWYGTINEVTVFNSGMDLFLNDLTLSLYKGNPMKLHKLETFTSKSFELFMKLLTAFEKYKTPDFLKNIVATLIPPLVTHHATLNLLGSVNNFKFHISEGPLSTLFKGSLKNNLSTFMDYMKLIFLRAIMECHKRFSRKLSKLSDAMEETTFDRAFKNINSLLECLENVIKTYVLNVEEDRTSGKLVLTLIKTLIGEGGETIKSSTDSSLLAELASSIHILSRKSVTEIRNLKSEQSSISLQAASIFELIMSSLAKIYVKSDAKETPKPLLTFSSYKQGSLESEAKVLVRTKDFVVKADDLLEGFEEVSHGKGQLSVNVFTLDNLGRDVERKLIEQSEIMYSRWSWALIEQYRELQRLHSETQHMKLLSRFREMFLGNGHVKVISKPILISENEGTMLESFNALKSTIMKLVFDRELHKRVVAIELNGIETASEKFLRILKILTEMVKVLDKLAIEYDFKILINEQFTETLGELEIYLGRKDEICGGLAQVMEAYGDAYAEVFDFLAYYYVTLTERCGLNSNKVEQLRINIEKVLRFKKVDGGLGDLVSKMKGYRHITDPNEALELKRRVQETISVIKEADDLANFYFPNEAPEFRLFDGLLGIADVRDRIADERFKNTRLYLVEGLKIMNNQQQENVGKIQQKGR